MKLGQEAQLEAWDTHFFHNLSGFYESLPCILKDMNDNKNLAILNVAEKDNPTVDEKDICSLAKLLLYIKDLKFVFKEYTIKGE